MFIRVTGSLLIALVFWLPLAGAQETGGVPAPARQAIIAVIQAQLNAFQRSDHAEAFSYASPQLRQQFQGPENFIAMVKAGYMAVYRPQSTTFLETRAKAQLIAQAVHFVGPDGAGAIAIYSMQRQPDGSWRIAAVHLVPTNDLAS
jgi:ketosteroid isomerase-like protein